MKRKIGVFILAALCVLVLPIQLQAADIAENIEETEEKIPVSDIEIEEHESEVEVGSTLSLSCTVLPSDATDTALSYRSSDISIATVSSTGTVKGIKKGKVTITVSAGGVSKSVPITVKVSTKEISINKEYLVLKVGQTQQLSAKVVPAEAKQAVTFSSADVKVATVSKNGLVTAKGKGSTTVIASNGDTSVAVSVIVNEAVQYADTVDAVQQETAKETSYVECVWARDNKKINSEMLSYFYKSKKSLEIIGEGYTLEIDGKDIVNLNNELSTDISMVRGTDTIDFVLNEGKKLSGAVTLYIEEPQGKYLYLYNESKERYELIEMDDMTKLELTTAGKYQIRETKLKPSMQVVWYMVIGGTVVSLIGVGVYIVVKRKYWFW